MPPYDFEPRIQRASLRTGRAQMLPKDAATRQRGRIRSPSDCFAFQPPLPGQRRSPTSARLILIHVITSFPIEFIDS